MLGPTETLRAALYIAFQLPRRLLPSTPVHQLFNPTVPAPAMAAPDVLGSSPDPMSVPVLTIPESAFDASSYVSRRSRSHLLRFLLTLTRLSALALILSYITGHLLIKPLMEKTTEQRLELLETYRTKLRDLYITVMGKVQYIPAIGFDKNGSGKVYADAVCQTTGAAPEQKSSEDFLAQDAVHEKLQLLLSALARCSGYLVHEMQHHSVIDHALKDLRQKTDMVYFDQHKLFNGTDGDQRDNMAQSVKRSIRSIKGMYMSGQA